MEMNWVIESTFEYEAGRIAPAPERLARVCHSGLANKTLVALQASKEAHCALEAATSALAALRLRRC
jgi:hypothetical protein